VVETRTPHKVSIVKVKSFDSKSVREATRRAVDLLGGMSSIATRHGLVVLKPNFCHPMSSSSGATTSLDLLEELIVETLDLDSRPVIVESSGIEYNTSSVFRILGVDRLAKKYGVEVLDAENLERTKVDLPNGILFDEIYLPKIVLQADSIVNIPKIKTHVLTTVTLALKNLMGLLLPADRKKLHFYNLEVGLLDVYQALKSMACVADGLVVMEGNGPAYGGKLPLGIVVAGDNLIATDRVCCRIMGIDASEIEYLKKAEEGEDEIAIRVEGDFSASFQRPSVSRLYRWYYGRILYGIDIALSTLTHQRTFLPYIFSHFGTRPKIVESNCSRCKACERVCPVGAIVGTHIDRIKCVRCFRCYEICPENAISAKGITKPLSKARV